MRENGAVLPHIIVDRLCGPSLSLSLGSGLGSSSVGLELSNKSSRTRQDRAIQWILYELSSSWQPRQLFSSGYSRHQVQCSFQAHHSCASSIRGPSARFHRGIARYSISMSMLVMHVGHMRV